MKTKVKLQKLPDFGADGFYPPKRTCNKCEKNNYKMPLCLGFEFCGGWQTRK